jgi:hypothetical protein
MDDTFLPANFEQPKMSTGGYMRLEEGRNLFRVLTSAITGFEYWNIQNKPVRSKEFPETLTNARNDTKVKFFWAFVVWNYKAKAVQILELTQSTIQEQIKANIDDPAWGDPRAYDININRSGQDLDTSYTVQCYPHKDVPPEAVEALASKPIYLPALYVGGNPFDPDAPGAAAVPFD